ncbi:porin [Arundinibacter roseus]|uniref:Porin n=1 Tax=Arundinibacter roseus TaxID=2070510 RepID=A0A4R4KPR7_9BACT|nr:porin [Arundinibacter roseus]TDB68916.1 porin [Arundinibacter roseus]
MKKLLIFFGLFLCAGLNSRSWAQSDSLNTEARKLTVSGYLETYYVYDFSNPENHTRPAFLYSYNRHNEVNLNLGFLQAEVQTERVRGKLAVMAGTYANANLAAEEGVLKNVFEANVGVKLSAKKSLWLDMGIFASHIGFESAIGANCWTMTRSLMAENSPYYLSGAKLTYTSADGQWLLSGLVLNGWQRIQRQPGNQSPAFGHQVSWTPTDRLLINSSSFVGNDYPESERRMRYFHNLYAQLQLHQKFGLILGFDIGIEQKFKGSAAYNPWYAPIMMARFTPSGIVSVGARAEYFADKNGVIIATNTPNGFQTFGYSVNLDVHISQEVLWRVEGRTFSSRDALFTYKNAPSSTNAFVGTSLSLRF